MKLEYYYDNNDNAKKSLRGGFILAIIFTFIFVMSRNHRIERIGIIGFIIECTAFFLLIFSVGIAVALINYIVNNIQRSKNKSVIETKIILTPTMILCMTLLTDINLGRI